MNVEGVSPPTPFLARPGKPALPWSDWIFSFHNYLTALGGEAYSTERKTALLLHCVGAEAQRVYRTLPVQPGREDEDEFHAAERQLAEFYEPQVNMIAERFFFRQRRQESHEPTADYVAALRRLAVNCSFGQMTDAMIRDQVVEATVHPILRERFLQDKGLTLDRVLEIAEAFERSRREATAMAGPARPAADGAHVAMTTADVTSIIVSGGRSSGFVLRAAHCDSLLNIRERIWLPSRAWEHGYGLEDEAGSKNIHPVTQCG
ncbi:hypothetical protein FJT64_027078 [Amphibalanus amphitrite]|uniref:Retrotransposon gag domain-containing protein n=1 Tax=Amphibalanus amphitrite TaxID=1232801 RepID=A0A6A4WEL9_AMPAM|nr:hypothetical protein FJT64_027078 [Amphibalanus amphitrite]